MPAKLKIGDIVTVKQRVEAYYSGYAGTPICFLEPGEEGVISAVEMPKVRKTPGGYYFYCIDFVKYNREWRTSASYRNIVLVHRKREQKKRENPKVDKKVARLQSNIQLHFNIEASKVEQIAIALVNAHTHEEVDDALQTASNLLGFYGVEAVRGDYHVDGYYQDIVALYVNSGETYESTIIYETETGRFIIWTLGDWIEKNQKKYNIL